MSFSRFPIPVSEFFYPVNSGYLLLTLSFTAEFHSQTAIEAAKRVNGVLSEMGKTVEDIKDITCRTHEACVRIIDKQFKALDNFADRDHCVQVSRRLFPTFYPRGEIFLLTI